MQKFIVGNWKMHGNAAASHALAEAVAAEAARHVGRTVVVCPPATLAAKTVEWLIGSSVKVGGQDCHTEAEGAFTGDIGAPMLAEAGCSYVIAGHSERRRMHHETSREICRKARSALAAALIPIICIGETADEREAGQAQDVVARQLMESVPAEARLSESGNANFLLAYEPVWAIGSGKTATGEDICQMHGHILSLAAQHTGLPEAKIGLLYGGSVTAVNAASILALPGVSGVLVGGASLKAEEFCRIIGA